MEPDVRIGVQPMPAGRVTTVYDGDGRIRVLEQCVGERHPRGAGPNDEIIGFELLVHAGIGL